MQSVRHRLAKGLPKKTSYCCAKAAHLKFDLSVRALNEVALRTTTDIFRIQNRPLLRAMMVLVGQSQSAPAGTYSAAICLGAGGGLARSFASCT
jgi:hypothetical protein